MKFRLASLKSLTNCEIPSSNPFPGACSGFLISACVSKNCSETRLRPLKIVPKAGFECTLEKNRPMRAKESWNRSLMGLSEFFFFIS